MTAVAQGEGLKKALTTRDIFAAGVGLVVAASTLVSDFQGWFTAGRGFAIGLIAMFVVNLLLGLSAAELSTTYPKAGALYDYGAAATPGGHAAKAVVGIFLGLLFYVMFMFAGAGETLAGGSGMVGLFDGGSVTMWVIVLTVLAVIPNLFGIEVLAKLELGLIVAMLAIRWFFGLAGFGGFSDLGGWSWDNIPSTPADFSGFSGLMLIAGAWAFWSFVGIEFVAPLAEETQDPARNIPRGIVWGLIAILATSMFMGLGVSGVNSDWLSVVSDDAPQLEVGEAMFGGTGRVLMALAATLASFASLTVVYASMPRILYGMSRNGHFLGPLSRSFGSVHARYRTPWVATIFTAVLYTFVTIYFGIERDGGAGVGDLIFTAAYVWMLLYVTYHVLVIVSRYVNPDVDRPFQLPLVVPAAGFLLTVYVWYQAFTDGGHSFYGPRALWMIGGSLVVAVLSYVMHGSSGQADHLEEEVHQTV